MKSLIFMIIALISLNIKYIDSANSFYIDYDANTFVKDGKPFRYVSGSIHIYRVPKELWFDRLSKMWAAGLNAVETYVFWNEHEQVQGVYNFEGQYDIFEFVKMAQKIGFVVIFRVGPYACGEHDNGGLPWWLLSNGIDSIVPRSSESNYMIAANKWLQVLLPKLAPYLYQNGGPVITVQVENEYGSYYTCDRTYTSSLRDIFRKYLGDDVILFTTDGNSVSYLSCGAIVGVYSTVDFGVDVDVNASFTSQRLFEPFGPLVNSEFYPGWLDFWGSPHSKVSIERILKTFGEMMDLNASVNFYMFHGGTNFGFSNGADPPFMVQPTSYDYDSPITEAGDITPKYIALRKAISKYLKVPQVPLPKNSTKLALGKVRMDSYIPLVDAIVETSDSCRTTFRPQSFEKLGQGYGFILYSTVLDNPNVDGETLSIPGIRDRAYVQIGSQFVGVIYRVNSTSLKISLKNNKERSLFIIVENMGRLNFGNDLLDSKGILSDVKLNGKVLYNWTTCLTQNFVPYFQKKTFEGEKSLSNLKSFKRTDVKNAPGIYIGEFFLPSQPEYFDTFLKMDQFTKGVAFIDSSENITNLGRYWPKTGPQVTLYTPGVFMKTNNFNKVVLIEFEGTSCDPNSDCYIEFIDYPIIDSL